MEPCYMARTGRSGADNDPERAQGKASNPWCHRGDWPSFAVFSDFSAHVERLLWMLGAMSWRMSDKEFWIQFFPVEGLEAVAPLLVEADE